MTFTIPDRYLYEGEDGRQVVLPDPPVNLSNASYAKLCFEDACYVSMAT